MVTKRRGTGTLPAVRAAAFIGLVRAGAGVDSALDASLKRRHGLSLRGYEVLLHLASFSADGALRMTQLSAQAPLSQSRTSRLVAELETAGLVRRSASADDSRGVTVAITDAGLAKLRAAQVDHHADLDRLLFSKLTKPEIAELARLTTKILGEDPLAR